MKNQFIDTVFSAMILGFVSAAVGAGLYLGRLVTFEAALQICGGGLVFGAILRWLPRERPNLEEEPPMSGRAFYGVPAQIFISFAVAAAVGGFVGAATAGALYFTRTIEFDHAFWIWVGAAVVGGVGGARWHGWLPEPDAETQAYLDRGSSEAGMAG